MQHQHQNLLNIVITVGYIQIFWRVCRETVKDQPEKPITGVTERILFVDDEGFVANSAKRKLEAIGYTVISETDSFNTIETFRLRPDDFDVIITDYFMPKMTELKLVEEIRKVRQTIPVIQCTGLGELVIEDQAKLFFIQKIIFKPCGLMELTDGIQEVMGFCK